MSQIYLIRHGQAGPRNRYDTLSDLGRLQAQRLGASLAASGLRFDRVLVGRLERQRLTAQATRDAYRETGLPFPEIEETPEWDEFDLGHVYQRLARKIAAEDAAFAAEYEAMVAQIDDPDADVHRAHNGCDAEVVRAWVEERYEYDGESWATFRGRVLRGLGALDGSESGRRTAVFTSATPVGISVGDALGLDDPGLWRLAAVAYNSGVSTLRLAGGERRLFSFNSVAHLRDPRTWTFR